MVLILSWIHLFISFLAKRKDTFANVVPTQKGNVVLMFHGFAFGIIIYSIRNKQMKNKHSQKQNTVTNTSSVMDDVKTICFFLTKDKQDVPTTKVMETNLQSNQMKREQQKLQTVSPSTPKIVVHFQFQERDKRGMNE